MNRFFVPHSQGQSAFAAEAFETKASAAPAGSPATSSVSTASSVSDGAGLRASISAELSGSSSGWSTAALDVLAALPDSVLPAFQTVLFAIPARDSTATAAQKLAAPAVTTLATLAATPTAPAAPSSAAPAPSPAQQRPSAIPASVLSLHGLQCLSPRQKVSLHITLTGLVLELQQPPARQQLIKDGLVPAPADPFAQIALAQPALAGIDAESGNPFFILPFAAVRHSLLVAEAAPSRDASLVLVVDVDASPALGKTRYPLIHFRAGRDDAFAVKIKSVFAAGAALHLRAVREAWPDLLLEDSSATAAAGGTVTANPVSGAPLLHVIASAIASVASSVSSPSTSPSTSPSQLLPEQGGQMIFASSKGAQPAVACFHKANEGFLYPLKSGLLFLGKPLLFLNALHMSGSDLGGSVAAAARSFSATFTVDVAGLARAHPAAATSPLVYSAVSVLGSGALSLKACAGGAAVVGGKAVGVEFSMIDRDEQAPLAAYAGKLLKLRERVLAQEAGKAGGAPAAAAASKEVVSSSTSSSSSSSSSSSTSVLRDDDDVAGGDAVDGEESEEEMEDEDSENDESGSGSDDDEEEDDEDEEGEGEEEEEGDAAEQKALREARRAALAKQEAEEEAKRGSRRSTRLRGLGLTDEASGRMTSSATSSASAGDSFGSDSEDEDSDFAAADQSELSEAEYESSDDDDDDDGEDGGGRKGREEEEDEVDEEEDEEEESDVSDEENFVAKANRGADKPKPKPARGASTGVKLGVKRGREADVEDLTVVSVTTSKAAASTTSSSSSSSSDAVPAKKARVLDELKDVVIGDDFAGSVVGSASVQLGVAVAAAESKGDATAPAPATHAFFARVAAFSSAAPAAGTASGVVAAGGAGARPGVPLARPGAPLARPGAPLARPGAPLQRQ